MDQMEQVFQAVWDALDDASRQELLHMAEDEHSEASVHLADDLGQASKGFIRQIVHWNADREDARAFVSSHFLHWVAAHHG